MYRNKIHARSLDSVNHPSRNWVKNFWGQVQYKIPDGVRICGENCYAKHSIFYTDLESYFLGFNAWVENTCMSWTKTMDLFNFVEIAHVPVIYEGLYDEDMAIDLTEELNLKKSEGYVIRLADSFTLEDFSQSVAKFVRPNHVTTDEHWMKKSITPNLLGFVGV